MDLDKLKSFVASDDEAPSISTLDTQVRTSKYALLPEPKDPSFPDADAEADRERFF